jgi:anti-sigma factor RsiW
MSQDLSRNNPRQLGRVREALRALSDEAPPPEVWDQVRQRAEFTRGGVPWLGRYPLAVAAGVFLAAVISVALIRDVSVAPSEIETVADAAELAALIATSQQLERSAQVARPAQVVWSNTRQALVYRIAGVDEALNQLVGAEPFDADVACGLWQQRVELMQSLVEVERSERSPNEYVVF